MTCAKEEEEGGGSIRAWRHSIDKTASVAAEGEEASSLLERSNTGENITLYKTHWC